jgi:hypothetical protein
VAWWRHVVVTRGAGDTWCHVVVVTRVVVGDDDDYTHTHTYAHTHTNKYIWSFNAQTKCLINNKVLSLSMFCYNMKLIPSIIAKLQPVKAKTMKIPII